MLSGFFTHTHTHIHTHTNENSPLNENISAKYWPYWEYSESGYCHAVVLLTYELQVGTSQAKICLTLSLAG